ncbi:MAG: tRNA uridine-5-carboxymethylaminomethyl(34) synthesis enzyme MnmG [Clostridia bacterium]|nr:tRNA uridine-5-carboxymethylaminomethyl(34) synthesis enzyme MnmG [Clostridia bacterium]
MKLSTKVAVIGAGHAGIEAALAAARMGVDTVLFTISLEAIANMPCNPSIGGTAKGHLVYEIDALGGEMGRAADAVTLQSRTLNLGKGAAVHSKRVQADRKRYQAYMKAVLEKTPHLRLIQAEIVTIGKNESGQVCSVTTHLGEEWDCDCVIVAAGTYLESRIFVGGVNYESGPDGFLPSRGLSASLAALGVTLRRFKTGTPARINRRSVDHSKLEVQDGEEHALPYAADTPEGYLDGKEQLPCHIVYTNAETHRIIRENLSRSAMYGGHIHGTGPRYCPSIEDKVVRFADKERHQLFLEPMGADTDELYLQGFSTSMPTDVQAKMLHTLPGFEHAEMMRYAYAIEYDCCDPTQLTATLEFRDIGGLFGAGQFNGTSGYEEAAAQGLLAGINAARRVKGEAPVILPRASSYLGTLVDDLIIKGTNEPYRMMTSRSEYRLLLRQDNADARLTPIGHEVGLIDEAHYTAFLQKQANIEAEIARLRATHLSPARVNPFLETFGQPPVASGVSLADLLRRPGIDYEALSALDDQRPSLTKREVLSAEVQIKYEGYINRQMGEVSRHEKLEARMLPSTLDYQKITGLRLEAAQKLSAVRPATVGQASRISGVSPADISVLLIYLGIR